MYQQTNHKKLKQFQSRCSIQSSISFITSSLLECNTSISYRFNICDSKDKIENFLVFQELEKISSKIILMKLVRYLFIQIMIKQVISFTKK